MIHALPSYLQSVAPIVSTYGYFGIFGLLFIEDFGLPVPGETMLIAASVFAGLGKLNIIAVIIAGIIAAFAGDNIGYAIGKYGGRRLLNRYGKYVFMTPEKINKATNFFDKRGGGIVIVARFIDGLRQLNGILAGMSAMKYPMFVLFNLVGASLWVVTWSLVGYFGGDHIEAIQKYGAYIGATLAAGVIGYFAVKLIRKRYTRTAQ